MALTHFTFGSAYPKNSKDAFPAMDARTISSEGIAPVAGNTQTTATSPAGDGIHLCRVSTDTAVYVAFGTNPNATTAATRFFMPANTTEYFIVGPSYEAAVCTI